jgi:hypothetical protein
VERLSRAWRHDVGYRPAFEPTNEIYRNSPISRGGARSPWPKRLRRPVVAGISRKGRGNFPACKALKTHKTWKFSPSPPAKKWTSPRGLAQLRRGRLESANDAGGIPGKHGATDDDAKFSCLQGIENQRNAEILALVPASFRAVPARSPRLVADLSNRDFSVGGIAGERVAREMAPNGLKRLNPGSQIVWARKPRTYKGWYLVGSIRV